MRHKSALLEPISGIAHGFLGRVGGVSTGIYASLNCGEGSQDVVAHIAENRRRVAAELAGHEVPLLSLNQVHSADVIIVTEVWQKENKPSADAMVTSKPGVILGILTADCGPVLFADEQAGVIGAAHAGWNGAFGGVLENCIAAMCKLGASREKIVAALGPTIAKDSYEVSAEFRDHALTIDAAASSYFYAGKKADHHQFDLPAYILHRLSLSGLQQAESLAMDTYALAESFFSYRRTTHRQERDYGRQISAIMLQN